jgi:hypothetical protein
MKIEVNKLNRTVTMTTENRDDIEVARNIFDLSELGPFMLDRPAATAIRRDKPKDPFVIILRVPNT